VLCREDPREAPLAPARQDTVEQAALVRGVGEGQVVVTLRGRRRGGARLRSSIAPPGQIRQLTPMSASVLERQQQLIRAMSMEEKIRASEALRAAAWDLKAAWIRSRHPELSDEEVRDAVRKWFRDPSA